MIPILLSGILPPELREDCIRSITLGVVPFRQYKFSSRPEPRIHVLLSPNEGEGYCYHGIQMRGQPISAIPPMERLHRLAGALYGLDFNIGVDILIYRNGLDSCGWHADDTQGERRVACVVLESATPRVVKFRPKVIKGNTLRPGDEQLELWISQSDAYDFDGLSQVGYEHCLPKRHSNQQRRICAVLRAGIAKCVLRDSGDPVQQCILKTTTSDRLDDGKRFLIHRPPFEGIFGHIKRINILQCYRRSELISSKAHRLDRRGIAGCQSYGADAVISSRTDPSQGEHDSFSWLTYTSSITQGGGALFKSYAKRLPIRVFRSSSLGQNDPFAPPPFSNGHNKYSTSYRYDGLYWVLGAYDEVGCLRNRNVDIHRCKGQIDGCHALTTFRLGRCCFQNGSQIPIRERSTEEIESEVRLAVRGMIDALLESTTVGQTRIGYGLSIVSSHGGICNSVNYSVELGRTLHVLPGTSPFKAQIMKPSKNKETWVQCDRCLKWRRIPDGEPREIKISFSGLKSARWECRMNPDRSRNSCAVDEENWDPSQDWKGDWCLSVEQEQASENKHRHHPGVQCATLYTEVYHYLQFRHPMLDTDWRDCLPRLRGFRGEEIAPKPYVSTKGHSSIGRPVVPDSPRSNAPMNVQMEVENRTVINKRAFRGKELFCIGRHPIVRDFLVVSSSVSASSQTKGVQRRAAVANQLHHSQTLQMIPYDMPITTAASTAAAIVPLTTIRGVNVKTDGEEEQQLLDQQPPSKRKRRFFKHPFSRSELVACKDCKRCKIGAVRCRAILGHISDG